MTDSGNDLFLLDERRESRRKAQAPSLTADAFFNTFVAELITQDYQLPGPEYLQYGVVDGPQDCGVDCLYTFVNGSLATEDFNRTGVPKNPDIDLIIIQAKTSPTFSEAALEKWAMYLPQLLTLDRDDEALKVICNQALLRETRTFVETYTALAIRRPRLKIRLCYASRGPAPSSGVQAKAEMTITGLSELYRDAIVSFEALGSRELVDLSRRPQQSNRVLRLAEVPITSDSGDGYVCLVSLPDFYELIKDPHTGRLDTALFEANVRDHEGETNVNSDIQQTLSAADDSFDFWWLNNGVTIVAEEISPAGKRLTLVSPQIVNGLQTSTEVFKYFNAGNSHPTGRHLLVRVIAASDSRIRDRIVKATNSQNELPESALRATEPFQRDIEEFLAPRGYYYDRRRNYARTRGYDEKRVISMAFAGQAVAAIVLQRPDACRMRGASILNDDIWYQSIFNDKLPLTMYHKAIWLLRRVQAAIVGDERIKGTSVEDWQYHVACAVAIMLSRMSHPKPQDIAGLDIASLSDEAILEVLEIVAVEYGLAIPASSRWIFADLSTNERTCEAIKSRTSGFLRSANWRGWPTTSVPPEHAIRASDVFYRRIRGE